jgi:hypothetical protein
VNNDENIRRELESLAQFLLIQFNNILREIRRVADVCLAKLIDSFPFLLWNGKIITTSLLIMKALIKNIDEDPNCTQSSIEFPDMDLSIHLQVSPYSGNKKKDLLNIFRIRWMDENQYPKILLNVVNKFYVKQ